MGCGIARPRIELGVVGVGVRRDDLHYRSGEFVDPIEVDLTHLRDRLHLTNCWRVRLKS
jgi:hypothetical protein